MDSYAYDDFDEHKMTHSMKNDGALEIRLSKAQSKVFDYQLSRFLQKKTSEASAYDGLMRFVRFFLNLGNSYHLWLNYPKLGIFDFVFESERPLHCRRSEKDGEVLYLFKKRKL